ncbi:hypothetical protein IscW_ISCW012902 [Ixodes scapularis]|uniref:Uncharacterized protein n=1 Tax=Ixodes scapularis TaxID=6945 RepID=B7QA94_IXOSC|nr:hypothetical protein IscW_ISCW012902 [Ixodes scapularis]|eukprot:XP_002400128.1 hypothetical protein IscW_ISCW012902 [Ixodes scapularis]
MTAERRLSREETKKTHPLSVNAKAQPYSICCVPVLVPMVPYRNHSQAPINCGTARSSSRVRNPLEPRVEVFASLFRPYTVHSSEDITKGSIPQ